MTTTTDCYVFHRKGSEVKKAGSLLYYLLFKRKEWRHKGTWNGNTPVNYKKLNLRGNITNLPTKQLSHRGICLSCDPVYTHLKVKHWWSYPKHSTWVHLLTLNHCLSFTLETTFTHCFLKILNYQHIPVRTVLLKTSTTLSHKYLRIIIQKQHIYCPLAAFWSAFVF